MPRKFIHVFLNEKFPQAAGRTFAARSIPVLINRVGKLDIAVTARAKFRNISFGEDVAGAPLRPIHIGNVNLVWELIDPLGISFTRNSITLDELDHYRNLRGFIKPWTLRIPKPKAADIPGFIGFQPGTQSVIVKVNETIPLSSAAPIVDTEAIIRPRKEFVFDLYRLGKFTVNVTKLIDAGFLPDIQSPSTARIQLVRPDGTVHLSGRDGILQADITLKELKWSRGANGKVQKWKLIMESTVGGKHKLFAQVYETLRIPKQLLLDRLDYLLGKDSKNLDLKVNWNGSEQTNQVIIKLKTDALAENFEMYNVLGKVSDLSVEDVKKNEEYTLYENPFKIVNVDYNVRFKDFKLDKFTIAIGRSVKRESTRVDFESPSLDIDFWPLDIDFDSGISFQKVTAIPAGLPGIQFEIKTLNRIEVKLPGRNPPALRIPKVLFEIAFDINAEGQLSCLCWLNIDTSYGNTVNELINMCLYTYLVGTLNKNLSEIIEGIFDNMLGGAFRFTKARWNSNAIEFDYVTSVLPERKPSPLFNPVVGHSSPGPGIPPLELRDTWSSPMLTSYPDKIKHIVVLMMENRSFDHVLGYLSLERPLVNNVAARPGPGGMPDMVPGNAWNADVNGLTNDIIAEFSDGENKIRHLKHAGFRSNAAGLKTKIPFSVGHHYTDVQQQIANNTMTGFVENFISKLPDDPADWKGTKPADVLGYYTQEELRMYKYLADQYTICDNYFCSHPGPTLPNRMYSLIGDLQKDRNGEPKLENSVETSFMLSRDITIFDVLSQHDIDWRVYESFPSVSMLRMFARYAGEEKKIRDITNLETDIRRSNSARPFPSVTFIDPAMHDAPANDDHPPADMLHGQHLIKRVYEALRSNKEVWDHTLFIINYDEHGGLFDHVPPKTAEILKKPLETLDQGNGPVAPRSRSSVLRNNEMKISYGVRVPAFIISPYAEKGKVYHQNLDHTSILKTILIRFCGASKPFLSDRVHAAHDLGGALTSRLRSIDEHSPHLPSLPDMRRRNAARASAPHDFEMMTRSKLSSKDADFHDFLAFLGRRVKPVK
ncbi:MAG: hypothetical protein H7Y86_02790 [Rhizobacter sp.]|nr:hypothetical protein [Ferruginibacter sp.]